MNTKIAFHVFILGVVGPEGPCVCLHVASHLPALKPLNFASLLRLNMAGIHITDIEAAINYWRVKNPSPDGVTLPAELRALAQVYALMVYFKEDLADEFSLPLAAAEAWQAWYASTPDTPCIAICSTFQGDAICKGCGRSFEEVQMWTEMSAGEKRSVWQRITLDGTSWRFNRYAERAAEDRSLAHAAAEAQAALDFQAVAKN